jgi:hypothetical protein
MNWEPVLTDLFSEIPFVADTAALPALFVVTGVVLAQCSCVGLVW